MSEAGAIVFRAAGAEPGVPLGKGSCTAVPQGVLLPAPFMTSITPQMAACKTFIAASMAANGVAPSYEEIASAIGLRAKSGVHRLITRLEQRGHLRRLKGQSRALQLIEQSCCPNCGHTLSNPQTAPARAASKPRFNTVTHLSGSAAMETR